MADKVDADFGELIEFQRNLGEVATNAGPLINSAVQFTSREIQKEVRRTVQDGNRRWKALPSAVTYDVTVFRGFGASIISSEIGYDKQRDPGKVGNLREFGSVKVAPHNDLRNALEKNEEDFVDGLDKALQEAERVLYGAGTVRSAARSIIKGRIE